jgi:hypothetical protein
MTAVLIAALIAGFASGPVEIQAAMGPGIHVGDAPVSARPAALTPKLTAAPSSAVPNKAVVLIGSGYSPKSVSGGTGSGGRHQITGTGTSIVTMSGTKLESPYITYPIDLDDGGSWVVELLIPGNSSTFSASNLSFVAKDSGGASASASVSLISRKISLDDTDSRIGTTVTIKGVGFPASNVTSSNSFRVNISYGSNNLTSVTPDTDGEFEVDFVVPTAALIPSTNTVTATIAGTTATATVDHSVPAANTSVSPTSGPSGTTVTVTGTNFRAFRTISDVTIGVLSILPSSSTTTDKNGSFTITGLVPGLPPEIKVVASTIGSVRSFSSFNVTVPDVPPTPTLAPTPTPAPSIDPRVGLAPLIEDENLVRVWHFDPAAQDTPPSSGWALYDPRPIFALANSVTRLTTGKFYWMAVKENQTVTLNGKERVLSAGWNPVSW